MRDDLNLQQLRHFVQVAELENISAAARELRLTQPALSRQMKALEEQLGWQLFERGKKSMQITHAGAVLQREAQKILRSTRLALQRAENEIEGAQMRVGFAPSLASGLVEGALKCFTSAFPRVRISWFDCSTQEMWRKLEAEELDLILEVETTDPRIEWDRLRQKDFLLMVPADHPFAKKRFVSPTHLDGERLLLLNRHDYPGYWTQVTEYFEAQSINAKIAGEFDGISSLRMGVEAGLGLALVGEGSSLSEKVLLKKLRPKPNPICVSLGHKSTRSLTEWEKGFLAALRN